jgi:hypothetical protein
LKNKPGHNSDKVLLWLISRVVLLQTYKSNSPSLNQAIFFIYLKNLFTTDPTNNSNDILKKPGQRNWLRNAAMAATGALVLLYFLRAVRRNNGII